MGFTLEDNQGRHHSPLASLLQFHGIEAEHEHTDG
jgi:hypothetical protein